MFKLNHFFYFTNGLELGEYYNSPWSLGKDKYVSFVNNMNGKDTVKLVITTAHLR